MTTREQRTAVKMKMMTHSEPPDSLRLSEDTKLSNTRSAEGTHGCQKNREKKLLPWKHDNPVYKETPLSFEDRDAAPQVPQLDTLSCSSDMICSRLVHLF